MTGVFDDFLPSLSKIGEEIQSLQFKDLSIDDTIREITRIIFTNSNLYCVYAKTIQEEKLVLNSVFCRDNRAAETFVRTYQGTPIDRERRVGLDNFVAVNGQWRAITEEKKVSVFFNSAIFHETSSEVVLPLKLSSKVIGIINMASSEIAEEWLPNKRSEAIIQLHTDAFELLISTIAQTLQLVENQEHE